MSDCIFCKIINGEIPSHTVYEDTHVKVFLDITQTTKGHSLLIPKAHVADVFEWTPEIGEAIGRTLPKIANALQRAFPDMQGLNIVNNNKALAYQTVFHSHIHLIPRYSETDGFSMTFTPTQQDMPTLAESIRKQLEDSYV